MSPRTRKALALLALCAGLRIVSLVRPCLSDDEATYCVVAREMLRGRVLYRDVVDHKPPLIYVTYAAAQAVGGAVNGMLLLHILTIVVVWATALLLGRIARQVSHAASDDASNDVSEEASGNAVPFVASLLYVVFTTTLLDFDALAANCELYMLLPLTASVLFYLRGFRTARIPDLLGAGALVGVAILYKYQAAVQLPLYAAHLVIVHRRRLLNLATGWGAIALGATVPLGGALWVLGRSGALGAALFWFSFNGKYIRQGMHLAEVAVRAVPRISYGVLPALLLWVLGLRAALGRWRRREQDPAGLFLIGWCAVSLLATTAGGRFFGHYFHQVTAPLAVLAAPGAVRLWRARRTFGLVAVGLPAAVFLLVGLFHAPMARAVGATDPDFAAIAASVRARSGPDDGLVIWGNLPVLYFEARRPLGTRFVFSNYQTGLSPATRTQSDPGADASANVVGESWEMFAEDLAVRRPKIFVDTSPGNLAGYGKFPLARFPRLQAIVDRNYALCDDVAGARLYLLRTP
jgi:4-amino-4-deoxy-L-arabinose transferase-like glycosyltransferase